MTVIKETIRFAEGSSCYKTVYTWIKPMNTFHLMYVL